MAFDAFISYSHAADGRLAPALQRAIQRLAKPWYRARALRVFRDESALSANPHLWSSIQSAMDESEWFVLLASPDAVASEWVNRELTYWLTIKSADRILVVVTDGTWEWDANAHAMTGTAVPAALREAFGDEPRHVDLRWAAAETDLDMHHARFRDVVAQLAAPMHGIAKDELDSEDVRQHRRARRLARGGVTALTLLVVVSLVFGTVAVLERNDARSQRNRASIATRNAIVRGLSSASAHMADSHRLDLALLLAAESYRVASDNSGDTVQQAEASRSLLSALGAEPSVSGILSGARAASDQLAFSSDGALVVSAFGAGEMRVWDARTRQPIAHQPPRVGIRVAGLAINRDHLLVTVDQAGDLRLWDLRANRPWRWQPPKGAAIADGAPGLIGQVALSDDGVLAVVRDAYAGVNFSHSILNLWNIETGRDLRHRLTLADSTESARFSPDGTKLAIGVVLGRNDPGLAVRLVDVASGTVGRPFEKPQGGGAGFVAGVDRGASLAFSPDGTKVTSVISSPPPGVLPTFPASGASTDLEGAATWDVATGRRVRTAVAKLDGSRSILAASPDGSEVAAIDAASGHTTILGPDREPVAELTLPASFYSSWQHAATYAAFDPTGRTFALATATGPIALVSLGTGIRSAAWARSRTIPAGHGPNDAFTDLFSPDGRVRARVTSPRRVRASTSSGKVNSRSFVAHVQLFDTQSGKPLTRQPPFDVPVDQRGLSYPFAFGSDGSLAISSTTGIVLWDVTRGRLQERLGGEPSECLPSSNRATPDIQLSYAGSGRHRRVVAACGDGMIVSWDLGANASTPQWRRKAPERVGQFFLLSADGSLVLAATPSGFDDLEMLDATTGRRLVTLSQSGSVAWSYALAPDGRTIAAFSFGTQGFVNLINARTGVLERTLNMPPSWYLDSAGFSPDGALITASTANAGIGIWDAATGEFVGHVIPERNGLRSRFASVVFEDGGRRLSAVNVGTPNAAPGSKRAWTLDTWSLSPTDMSAAACDIAGRNFSRSEWTQLVGSDVPYERTCQQWPAGT